MPISYATPAAMLACVVLCIISCALSECVTVHRHFVEPETKNREELSPLIISCKLNDIITIRSPVKHEPGTLYYLHSPDDGVTQLNITGHKHVWDTDTYKVTNVNDNKTIDTTNKTIDYFKDGDINIGPLTEEDYGNWVLSVYRKVEEEWTEWFQVINIAVIEEVPLKAVPELYVGDTVELSYAYPIKHLQSCQLSVPLSSYDRFYERVVGNTCSFIVRNLTFADMGPWRVLGVGRIAYSAETVLKVRNKIT